jgi:small subunit ribosomal protein S3
MGQKVHPRVFRTGVIYSWESKWFGKRADFSKMLQEDHKIRVYLREKLKEAAVERIEVDRTARAMTITIHTAKPGLIIGRGGDGVETLKKEIRKLIGKGGTKDKVNMNLNIQEIANPSMSAAVILQSMAAETEKRMPFRRILKTHLERIQKAGAKGAKLQMKGRLNGAEIAREEKLLWGSVPLTNLRADVNYADGFAKTLFGTIGIKVWIYRGEVFGNEAQPPAAVPGGERERGPRPMGGPRGPRTGGPGARPMGGARPISRTAPAAKPAAKPAAAAPAKPEEKKS